MNAVLLLVNKIKQYIKHTAKIFLYFNTDIFFHSTFLENY